MIGTLRVAMGALTLLATPAAAEVRSASATGFELEQRVTTALPPARLYQLVTDVPAWWSPAHTYSGKATNLRLSPVPGGCWCETLPDGGGVEHMRVALVEPGRRIILTGGLGPLLTQATTGVMQLTIAPSGAGSTLTMNYRAAGFFNGGADKLAPLVDQVLGEQATRLHKYAEDLAVRR